MSNHIFTSESVAAGHPDKFADQISDTVLDELLRAAAQKSEVRCACETLITGDQVVVAGEIGQKCEMPDVDAIVRRVAKDIGYDDARFGFDGNQCQVTSFLTRQSPDIAQGVDGEGQTGAGDQGMMFGYACDETPEKMPLPLQLAHRLMRRHRAARQSGELAWLRPDAKAQVSVRYAEGEKPRIAAVVLSTQHDEEIDGKSVAEHDPRLHEAVIESIIRPVLDEAGLPLPAADNLLVNPAAETHSGGGCTAASGGEKVDLHINPTGRFVLGGPAADCGLTGRKIIVDTYGGAAAHGGGAFSGKDPTKVDRSAAYMARRIAKNIVAADLAKSALVQISYAIGRRRPVSLMVKTTGGKAADGEIEARARRVYEESLTPDGIIKTLDLWRPIYQKTAAYGHFGREDDSDFSWESTAEKELLRE